MFREDIQDMQLIRDMGSMRLLSDILPSKVGSLLSINSIREDLEVSFRAVAHWIDVLESFYYLLDYIRFSGKKIRSLKKSLSFICGIGQRSRTNPQGLKI